jgi:hypothetical protein
MSFAPIIAALALPPETLVGQRVPKKLLVENGAPTAGDKRQINDGIEEILWHAALKPANLGVPPYRDAVREYLEIAILTVSFRPAAKPIRLVELIHRAIPYPVLLVATIGDTATISVAHKRWSQGVSGQIVIEELRATAPFRPESATAEEMQFLARLAVGSLPQASLFALYQSWMDSVLALEAAQITGAFVPPPSAERSVALRENLDSRTRALRDVALLRAQAENETQLNRRVEINLAIKNLDARIAELDANL